MDPSVSPPTMAPRRSGMMFCVVGDGFTSAELFEKKLCDYIVYPDLVAKGGEFVPLFGKVSWDVFRAAFAKALARQHYTEPMTFLGVWMYKGEIAREFASEVTNVTQINTIIIQTHVSPPFRAGHTLCVARPICAIAETDLIPSFEVAQQAASLFRSRGDKFRIVFSSTLGVMVYVGQAVENHPSGPNDGCDSSYMADRDFTCSGGTTSLALEMYDKDEMYAYVVYQDGPKQHFVTYETPGSLLEKMNLYIETLSDGWAFFEAHRDSAQSCADYEHFQRLETVQFTARNRSRSHRSYLAQGASAAHP
ncbi:uncharacterized protein LOC142582611 isoform X2 [Dermacentor variabilis]|uniref:uncharacterized protein LOC142582611 isoform X2 n=1 Tax=Dermacentor variabilis TaxID=34621 RepID=UPI003F5B230A